MNMATWTAVGISIGAAMGSATDNMAVWVASGAATGVAIGIAATRNRAPKSD